MAGNTAYKISRKLRHEQQTSASPGKNLRVILQLNSAPTGQLNSLLRRNGARVKGNFADVGVMALDLPADALDELASNSEVAFLSQDEPIGAMGYVTSTTGTDAVRTQTTSNGGLLGLGLLATTTTTTYDGSGIGIAVIDSGIDQSHESFRSRIAVSKDFTGKTAPTILSGTERMSRDLP